MWNAIVDYIFLLGSCQQEAFIISSDSHVYSISNQHKYQLMPRGEPGKRKQIDNVKILVIKLDILGMELVQVK